MRRAFAASLLLALALHAPTIAQQVGESVNVMPVWTPCDLATDPASSWSGTVATGASVGATTLQLTGLASGVLITAGDRLTITSDPTVYVVASDVAVSLSGSVTVPLTAGLVAPVAAGGAVFVQHPGCPADSRWADAWRYGDIFLQRQVEPSIAVAATNPEHMLTGVIDYSAVEVSDDQGTGSNVASRGLRWLKDVLARALGRGPVKEPTSAALGTGEAWIRLIWSTNGGATGTPFFMPGAPWDTSPAASTAPYYLRATGASDPVIVAAPDNRFFVTFMAFKRGDINYLMLARFRDEAIPDPASRHSLVFEGFTTLASGNNATFGTLNDKPHSIVVPDASSPLGYAVYVSYTLFNGNPGGSKFQSQLFVAKSLDGGNSFTTTKINQSTNENTGTVLVARPNGRVVALWRSFGASPTIFASVEGATAWSKPSSILSNEKTAPLLAVYDQGSIKVNPLDLAASAASVTPRSNAFPSAALAPNGTIFVVWQECVSPTTALPLACASGGSPRVVLKYSTDDGATWLPTQRKAIDTAPRQVEPDGLGYFFNVGRDNTLAHPQLMPAIACGGGQCLVTYWESRTNSLAPTGRISGYHRLMDLRGALLKADGTVDRSFQISRYPYRAGTKLVDASGDPRAENVNDIERVCTGVPGAEPPGLGVDAGCIPRLNFYARPQSGGGLTAFVGDYNSVIPSAPFAPGTGAPRAASTAADVPWVGFLSASTDNRNLIPPASAMPQQLGDYASWQPGVGGLPSCSVGGSRNSDTLLARVSLGLVVAAPVTVQAPPPAGQAATFVVQVANNSSAPKTVTFAIGPTGSKASFAKDEVIAQATVLTQSGSVVVNAHSSTSREVYVPSSATSTEVYVSDGTATTRVTLRLAAPAAAGTTSPSSIVVSDPVNISAENISAENISAENISAENISAENISAENISAENISAENFGIQETTWVVQASGDATKSYQALPQIDKAYSQDYEFRMVIYRLSSIGACVDAGGNVTRQYQATVVANTGAINISAENISAENISAENISAENGFPSDGDASVVLNNSVFTPKATGVGSLNGGLRTAAAAPAATCSASTGFRIGECVEARPPEPEYTVVKLLAVPNKDVKLITRPYNPAKTPAALTVADYWCEVATGCAKVEKGADLAVAGTPDAAPTTVIAGQSVTFPANGYSVTNAGTLPAGPRRYGVYLSSDTTLDLVAATGLVDAAKDRLLTQWTVPTDLPVGAADAVPAFSVPIAQSTAPGTYYLFLYADDLREVSELREDNNITTGIRITVLPPEFDKAITLLSPCAPDGAIGADCVKSGNGAVPLAWQFTIGGVVQDTGTVRPTLRFYRASYDQGTKIWTNTGSLVGTANPGDVATGSSDFQYCGFTGTWALCSSRGPGTWQYNWQRLEAVTGATLRGYFLMHIDVPSTSQTGAKSIGPLKIYLP